MKEYFECNLSKTIPMYFDPDLRRKLDATVRLVYARTEKLNEALKLSGLKPATFHKLAKTMFDLSYARFDRMTAKDIAAVSKLLYDGTEAPDRIEWPNAIVLYDTAFVSTADWESLRHFSIGGSESSIVMGVNSHSSREKLFFDKLGLPVMYDDKADAQKVFDRGHFMEDRVIDLFCKYHGAERVPESRMFKSAKDEFRYSSANLDGVLRFRNPDGSERLALFEAKTTADFFANVSQWFGDGIPASYLTQIHQYMGVMDDPRLSGIYIGMLPVNDVVLLNNYIGSEYDPSKYRQQFVERDTEYEEMILSQETEFWTQHIEKRQKPAPSKDSALNAAINLRYKESPATSNGSAKPATAQLAFDKKHEALYQKWVDMDRAYAERKAAMETAKNARDLVQEEIKAELGSASKAEFKDAQGNVRMVVSNTPIVKYGIDTELLQIQFPEVYETVKKQHKPSTKFTLKYKT